MLYGAHWCSKDGIAMMRCRIHRLCRISVLFCEPNVPEIVLAVGYGILKSEVFMNDTRSLVKRAIKSVQSRIRWRHDSAAQYLVKRKARRQLPANATLAAYEQIITTIVHDPQARVFVYWHEQRAYPTVVSVIGGEHWLVMLDESGFLESAFVIDRPERYLMRPQFQESGVLEGSTMSHEEIDRVLTAYETDVRFPEASGMELLDMLLKRSEIAQADREQLLTVEQRRRLAAADRVLALQARHFYASIQRIADLEVWRQHEGAPPEEWWWYLDVLAHTPIVAADDTPVPA
jgi:hypothetical protein